MFTVRPSWTEDSVNTHWMSVSVDRQLHFPSIIFHPSGTENNTEQGWVCLNTMIAADHRISVKNYRRSPEKKCTILTKRHWLLTILHITHQMRPYQGGGLAWLLRSIDKLVHEETYPAVSQPCKVTFETVQWWCWDSLIIEIVPQVYHSFWEKM